MIACVMANAWKGKGPAAKITDFIPKFVRQRVWPTVQTIRQRLGMWFRGKKQQIESRGTARRAREGQDQ